MLAFRIQDSRIDLSNSLLLINRTIKLTIDSLLTQATAVLLIQEETSSKRSQHHRHSVRLPLAQAIKTRTVLVGLFNLAQAPKPGMLPHIDMEEQPIKQIIVKIINASKELTKPQSMMPNRSIRRRGTKALKPLTPVAITMTSPKIMSMNTNGIGKSMTSPKIIQSLK